jgi:hypothetical protein
MPKGTEEKMMDPRIEFLKDHTCEEFLGACQEASDDREDDIVSHYPPEAWAHALLFPLGFLDDKPGFQLLGPPRAAEPDLFLVQSTSGGQRLAGLYQGSSVGILPEFWQAAGLGRELIFEAFLQCQWKNKEQQYTKLGLNSFKRAHRAIVKRATELGIRGQGLPLCSCKPEELHPQKQETVDSKGLTTEP